MVGKLNIQSIDQIGIVVPDLDAAAELYGKQFGVGSWRIFTLGGPRVRSFVRGEEVGEINIKIGWAQVGSLTVELLQPVSGRTLVQEFLDQRGAGLHHIGIGVPDVVEAAKEMRELGYAELTSFHGLGPEGKGVAIYFDTQAALGTILELMPARR